MHKIFSVEYEIDAQSWTDGQFSIPTKVAEILDLSNNSTVLIEITSQRGTKNYISQIKSGLEVYGLKEHISAGEYIRVRVTNAPVIK